MLRASGSARAALVLLRRVPAPATAALVAVTASALSVAAAPVASVFGGRIPCAERDGVQFCEGGFGARVESFDGVPIDANLTLPPASEDGPFPLIVQLHGWGGSKSDTPAVEQALAGYAVLSTSARGFGGSCGSQASRVPDASLADPDVCVERGWVHLGDARYEARDTQHLAGVLADEGVVLPRIGVTGGSYGGGQSLILAALRNRVMLPDGSLIPWQSPLGLDMEIAAAAPLIPWSDLAESLVPAGRTLDYRALNPYPIPRVGVQKQQWVAALYLGGQGSGYYAPPGADPGADLQRWNQRLNAGEPYDGDPEAVATATEIATFHSAYAIDDSIAPAPLFIYNAWTDDLFPADEAVRYWRKATSRHPDADVSLHFADAFGHPRAGLDGDVERVTARVTAFFAHHLLGEGEPPPPLETWTQGCADVEEAGPYFAADWDALHPGEVRYRSGRAQSFGATSADPAVANALSPLFGGGPCRTLPADRDPGAATYVLPAARGAGYTLMGAPTVIVELDVSGSFAQLAARLWDVAPDGTQTLVTHSLHRPRTDNLGPQVYQLHPNGWHFAAGHAPKLELLGGSPPSGRASNGAFEVTVESFELRLPVVEAPGSAGVHAPREPVLPPDAPEPPDAGTPACPAAPRNDCAAALSGRLSIGDDAKDARDRLAWRWRGDAADFGDPTATAAFALCVYDGAGALAASVAAPAGGTCAGRGEPPCWSERRSGFRYDDRAAASSGLRALELRPGGRRSAIELRAEGGELALPALPLALPARAQLVGNAGACWESAHSDPAARNDATRFRDAAD